MESSSEKYAREFQAGRNIGQDPGSVASDLDCKTLMNPQMKKVLGFDLEGCSKSGKVGDYAYNPEPVLPNQDGHF